MPKGIRFGIVGVTAVMAFWIASLQSPAFFAQSVPNRLFVNASAIGANNGSNWGNAFIDLQDALSAATNSGGAITEIWVAGGTYRPAGPGGDRAQSFRLLESVAVYGGFAGTESSLDERQLGAHSSTLSGDLNGDDTDTLNHGENSYHVVDASGVGRAAILDGFFIVGGFSDGTFPHNCGAGIYMSGGSPIIRNCWILFNQTGNGQISGDEISANAGPGGGVYCAEASNPLFYRCTISQNQTGAGGTIALWEEIGLNGGAGAGLYLHSSSMLMVECEVSQNVTGAGGDSDLGTGYGGNSGSGGGIYALSSSLVLADCVLKENGTGRGGNGASYGDGGSAGDGAAIFCSLSSLALTRTTLANNATGKGGGGWDWNGYSGSGGALYLQQCSDVVMDQCTLENNVASDGSAGYGGGAAGDGGAIFADSVVALTLTQCRIAGNVAGNGGTSSFWRTAEAGTGGGLYLSATATTISKCTIENNATGSWGFTYELTPGPGGFGGGIYAASCSGTLSKTTISGNVTGNGTDDGDTYSDAPSGGGSGGGICFLDSNFEVKQCTIASNKTGNGGNALDEECDAANGGLGAGVYCHGGTARFSDCVLKQNEAGSGGNSPYGGYQFYAGDGGSGAGLYCAYGTFEFVRCEVSENQAGYGGDHDDGTAGTGGDGGGLCVKSSAVLLDACTVQANAASSGGDAFDFANGTAGENGRGGGMLAVDSQVRVLRSRFSSNQAGVGLGVEGWTIPTAGGEGGGICLIDCPDAQIALTDFVSNQTGTGGACIDSSRAGGNGGGIAISGGNAVLTSCAFLGNITGDGGDPADCFDSTDLGDGGNGAAIYSSGDCSVINCTLAGNWTGRGGKARSLIGTFEMLYGDYGQAAGIYIAGGTCNAFNSILWGNRRDTDTSETAQIVGPLAIRFSCVSGWTGLLGGENNSGRDPLFADADGPDNDPLTALDNDVRLQADSPCIDAGDNTAVPADTYDLNGNGDTTEPMPFDLQLRPRFTDDPVTPDTGVGANPQVDRGAHEFGWIWVDDDSPADPAKNDSTISDPLEVGSPEHPFDTIQEAIDAAAETHSVVVRQGTYFENVVYRGRNITVRSTQPYDPAVVESTIINGNASGRGVVFQGSETFECHLMGFTITQCYGMIVDEPDQPIMVNGGGILGNGTQAMIVCCRVVNNAADGAGGGIADCDGWIVDSIISDNFSAESGGGLAYCDYAVINCEISNNEVSTQYSDGGGGGGLYQCKAAIEECTIQGNSAYSGGGLDGCSGNIAFCEILDNTADGSQGDGGGLNQCTGTVSNCLIRDNDADGYWGGGLNLCPGPIISCWIINNTAASGGGGLANCGEIQNCLIAGNQSLGWECDGGGGAFRCQNLTNCTIANNKAFHGGSSGGIDGCGGGILEASGQIRNCIVWGNWAAVEGNQIHASVLPSYSCIQDWTDGGTGNINADPQLDQDTFHLRLHSPCIDTGCAVAGLARDIDDEVRGFEGDSKTGTGDSSETDMGFDEFVAYSPLVWVNVADNEAFEYGLNPAVLEICRVGGLANPIQVAFSWSGTAKKSADYAAPASPVTLAANQRTVRLVVTPKKDGSDEGSESVILSLRSGAGYQVVAPVTGEISINDHPALPVVTVAVADAICCENPRSDTARIRLDLDQPTDKPLTIFFRWTGTAKKGLDYSSCLAWVTVGPGESSKEITITARKDGLAEGNETVRLEVLASSNYVVGNPSSGTVTIIDASPSV